MLLRNIRGGIEEGISRACVMRAVERISEGTLTDRV